MWRILVADDHGLYRKGLALALQRAYPDATILTADCFDATLALVEQEPELDLLVIDLHMPQRISMESLCELSRAHRNLPIVALSASEAPDDILECLACGLHGYISKLQSDDEIIAGIADVLAGKIYVTPRLAFSTDTSAFGAALKRIGPTDMQLARLTPRQKQVLHLLAEGKSNKEIARALDIAETTVKVHAAAVVRALGARNRTAAALMAKEWLAQDGTEGGAPRPFRFD